MRTKGLFHGLVFGLFFLLTIADNGVPGFITNVWAVQLPVCEPRSGSFNNDGERHYFEVSVEASKHLLVVFDGPLSSSNDLYIKYNQIPTETDYDARNLNEQDPAAGVSETQAGVYYIMIANDYIGVDPNYTISACYHLEDLRSPISSKFDNDGERHYFEARTRAGENLLVVFDGPLSSSNDLYIKYNQIPTETDYDARDLNKQDPAAGVYGTQAGVYYIMIANDYIGVDPNYTISASSSINTATPAVYLNLNGTAFRTGNTIIATATVTNGADSYTVEAKIYVTLPPPNGDISLIDKHHSFILGGGAEGTAEILRHTFGGGEPEGSYEIVIRLEDATRGADFGVARRTFTFLR